MSKDTQFYKCVFKRIMDIDSPSHNFEKLYDRLLHLTHRIQALNQPNDRDRYMHYVRYVKLLKGAFAKSNHESTKILFKYFSRNNELPEFAEAYLSLVLGNDLRKQIEDECFDIYLQGMPDVQLTSHTKQLLVANMVNILQVRQRIHST